MKPKPNFLSKKSEIKGVVETLDNSITIKCLYIHKYKVYNFQSVQNEITDQTITTRNGKAYVNFCQDTVTKINNEASESTLIYTKDVNTFTRYTATLDVLIRKMFLKIHGVIGLKLKMMKQNWNLG